MNKKNQNRIENYSGIIDGRSGNIFCKSNIGKRNLESHFDNQDAFDARINENYMVVAVADGLGSCEHSQIGSQFAVNILCDWVEKELIEFKELDSDVSRILCNRIVDRWRNTIGDNYAAYDTTLLFIVYIKKSLLIGSLGDGMVLLDIGGEYKNLSWKDKVFGNQTASIGSINAKEEFKIELIRNIDINDTIMAVIATDGISDDIDEQNQIKLVEYVKNITIDRGFEETSKEINQWVDNWKSLYNSDDKTIAIISI